MTETTVLDDIRLLIQQNEVDLALEQVTSLLKGINSDLFNEAILQQSRLTTIRKRERQGLLTPADGLVQQNQITAGVLELIDDVARQLKRGPVPLATGTVIFIESTPLTPQSHPFETTL